MKRCIECTKIVSGGGAAEMEVMRALRDLSRGEMGKQQLIIAAFAKAMEIIPRQLADNAGFDTTYVVRPCVCVYMCVWCVRGDKRLYYEHKGGTQGGRVGDRLKHETSQCDLWNIYFTHATCYFTLKHNLHTETCTTKTRTH